MTCSVTWNSTPAGVCRRLACALAALLLTSGCTDDDGLPARAGSSGTGGAAAGSGGDGGGGYAGSAAGAGATSDGGAGVEEPATLAPLSKSMQAALASVDPSLVERTGCDDDLGAMRAQVAEQVSNAIDGLFGAYAWRCYRDTWIEKLAGRDLEGNLIEPSVSMPYHVAPSTPFRGTKLPTPEGDDADLMKTDGEYVYVADEAEGHAVRILDVWPPEQAHVVARVVVPGFARQVLVHEDRLLVYSSIAEPNESGPFAEYWYAGRLGHYCMGLECGFESDGRQTMLQIYDISDRATPQLVREIKATGSLVGIRRSGRTAHALVYDEFLRLPPIPVLPERLAGWRPDLPDTQACGGTSTYAEAEGLFRAAQASARQKVAALPSAELLPAIDDSFSSGVQSPCDKYLEALVSPVSSPVGSVHSEPGGMARGFMNVISFDLHETSEAAVLSFRSLPGPVHVAADTLYLGDRRSVSGLDLTGLHKFDISNGRARYAASGVAPGAVSANSMNVQQQQLRVVGTTSPEYATTTAVTVLEEQQGQLQRVGSAAGLEPRPPTKVYFGDERASVVLIQRTDATFLVDLTDATQPRLAATVELPKLSADVQLIDPTHLLASGADFNAEYTEFRGFRLHIADITDPDAPTTTHTELLQTKIVGTSNLQPTFAYSTANGRLVWPMTLCRSTSNGDPRPVFSGMLVYRATSAHGFEQLGRVQHAIPDPWIDPISSDPCGFSYHRGMSAVRRTFWMDDYLYSVSAEQLKVNHAANLSDDIAVVPFSQ